MSGVAANPVGRLSSQLGLAARLLIFAAILLADKLALNPFVDFDLAVAAQGFGQLLRHAQHWGFRFIAAFGAALALFAYVRGGDALRVADSRLRAAPLRIGWIGVHLALLGLLVPLTFSLFHPISTAITIQEVAAVWTVVALIAAAALGLALAPAQLWWSIGRSLGVIWVYALIAALIGSAAINVSTLLWAPTAGFTFQAVALLLRGAIPDLQIDTATRILSSGQFSVRVSDECSGLEGVGLILAFLVCWLAYFRSEYRFPRALVLIPAGVAIIFALNILRIAAFMMIGHAGYAEVAIYGFHSQAGWMSFVAVACGLAAISRNSAWLNRRAHEGPQPREQVNHAAVYLLPLLAILGSGLVSHALSGRFETFYPLRVIAALWVLFSLRRHLLSLNWSFSWRGVAVGAAVFGIWWIYARWVLPPSGLPDGLAALSPQLRVLWVASRICGAVITVPLAEELTYRGFLMRRFQNPEFQDVSYAQVQWLPLAASSLLFGVMHGSMWLPGMLAGLAYALIAKHRNGLGEAVIAHATSNALIAICVLAFAQWQLW